MQKLVLGIAFAAVCVATPSRAAEDDQQPAQPTEAAPTDGSEAPQEGDGLLAFPPAKKVPPPGGGAQAEGDGADTANTAEPSQVGAAGSTQGADAPTKTSDAASTTLTKNVLLFNQQATAGKKFGLLATVSTYAGSGTFIANNELRHQSDYIGQIFDFRPTFGFNLGSHRMRLQGRVAFETEYTQPNTNPARRWKPFDSSITIADDTLYTEPVTNILFNTAFRLSLPTSYESINVRQQWLAATLLGGARRLIGPIQLSYTTAVTKYVNGAQTPQRKTDAARSSDLGRLGVEAIPPIVTGNNPDAVLGSGGGLNNWLFSNNFSVTYLASDNLAISYSVGVLSYIKYDVGQDDQFVSPNADAGAGTSQLFQSGLNFSYDLTHFSEDVWHLPFRLTASLGASSVHPLQQTDNTGWIPPVVFNTFFDRAYQNYGTVYLDLTAIY